MSTEKTIFVTVGTTSFDKLIQKLNNPTFQRDLFNLGFTRIVFQIGNGKCIPSRSSEIERDIKVDYFRLKDSIRDEINNADLVISHAGAGSILETLEAGKPLIVVVNEDLMGNHQIELAKKLSEDQHLQFCICSTLDVTLKAFDPASLKPFPKGKRDIFLHFLNTKMGFE